MRRSIFLPLKKYIPKNRALEGTIVLEYSEAKCSKGRNAFPPAPPLALAITLE
jgi:hypothetical protein